MKSLKKLLVMLLLFTCYLSSGQTSQNDDISSLPIDSKTNCYVRYYYFPNLEAYFDKLELVYHYKVNGKWEKAKNLPTNFGGYSIYNKVRVAVTDFDGEEPYQLLKTHKKMYPYNSKVRFTNQTVTVSASTE
ncbi:hypothetical protein [Flavobacterium sp.]|uniref:hypothetical protein n=1 Tax=Flavobacterium sp. TaxID=239 RepID=UPI00286B2C99|nr:hypothetical protein [Flavobacterium sp.]